MTDTRSRLKSAELLSMAGAAVLGAGIALFLQRWLSPFAALIVVSGLVTHAWGMFQKHRIEAGQQVQTTAWEVWLYRLCWLALAGLAAYLLLAAVQPFGGP